MTRTLTFPLQLTWDEIAYLFATLNATHIPGMDVSLFPGEEEARREKLINGYEALRADGWLEEVALDGRTYVDLNSWLLEFVAALADPEGILSIAVRRKGGLQSGRVLVYFSSDKVLEIAPAENGLRIQALASEDVLLQSLADLLQLPESREERLEVVLSEEDAKALAEGYLVGGEENEAVASLAETRKHLVLTAEIVTMKVREAEVQESTSTGLLVGGKLRQLAWWMEREESGVRYITCDRKFFVARLHRIITDFLAV